MLTANLEFQALKEHQGALGQKSLKMLSTVSWLAVESKTGGTNQQSVAPH
jgi:hypothetical protein